jgi:hypothetical protein
MKKKAGSKKMEDFIGGTNNDSDNIVVDPSASFIRRRINRISRSENASNSNTAPPVMSQELIEISEFHEFFVNEPREEWWTFRIPWLCGDTDILVWGLGRVLFLLIGVYFLIRNYLSSRSEFIQEGLEMEFHEHHAE